MYKIPETKRSDQIMRLASENWLVRKGIIAVTDGDMAYLHMLEALVIALCETNNELSKALMDKMHRESIPSLFISKAQAEEINIDINMSP